LEAPPCIIFCPLTLIVIICLSVITTIGRLRAAINHCFCIRRTFVSAVLCLPTEQFQRSTIIIHAFIIIIVIFPPK
jgi:hypothetical protein